MRELLSGCPACGRPRVHQSAGSVAYVCGARFYRAFGSDWERAGDADCRYAFDLAVARGRQVLTLMAQVQALAAAQVDLPAEHERALLRAETVARAAARAAAALERVRPLWAGYG